jgi:DNA-binding response OmpR family regulator
MAASILIVDDDLVLGRIMARTLGRDGQVALAAADADQAVLLARQHRPRLALVDLCMPGADGVETAGRLRAECPGLVCVLLTAYPLRLGEHPRGRTQFARVLLKPLDLTVLRATVRELLTSAENETGAVRLHE